MLKERLRMCFRGMAILNIHFLTKSEERPLTSLLDFDLRLAMVFKSS